VPPHGNWWPRFLTRELQISYIVEYKRIRAVDAARESNTAPVFTESVTEDGGNRVPGRRR